MLFALALFGGLFGAGTEVDCARSDARAERAMRQIEQQWPLRASNDPVTAYVQRLAERLSGVAGDSWRPHVYIVRNLEPVAFAVGGGRFVISDGLIAFVRDESQLAAVLAHELSHQRLGHFCSDASPATERINLGSVVQHFDLELELEADRAAERSLAATDFEPRAMGSVLGCLAESGAGGSELATRIGALGRESSPPAKAHHPDSATFTKVRALIDEEIGDFDQGSARCGSRRRNPHRKPPTAAHQRDDS